MEHSPRRHIANDTTRQVYFHLLPIGAAQYCLLTDKYWQHFAQTILCQLRSISGHVVTSRNDHIGVYVVAKHPYTAHYGLFLSILSLEDILLIFSGYKKFLGSVIYPVRAVAATVAGLPR